MNLLILSIMLVTCVFMLTTLSRCSYSATVYVAVPGCACKQIKRLYLRLAVFFCFNNCLHTCTTAKEDWPSELYEMQVGSLFEPQSGNKFSLLSHTDDSIG